MNVYTIHNRYALIRGGMSRFASAWYRFRAGVYRFRAGVVCVVCVVWCGVWYPGTSRYQVVQQDISNISKKNIKGDNTRCVVVRVWCGVW